MLLTILHWPKFFDTFILFDLDFVILPDKLKSSGYPWFNSTWNNESSAIQFWKVFEAPSYPAEFWAAGTDKQAVSEAAH